MTFPLDITVSDYKYLDNVNSRTLNFRVSNEELVTNFLPTYTQSVTINQALDTANFKFPTIEEAINYVALTANPWLLNEVNTRGTDVYVLRDTLYWATKSMNDMVRSGGGTPGAHINDAPTDAPTNLTGLTSILLTAQLNATNTKQNQIATVVNTILDRLEAKGILATS